MGTATAAARGLAAHVKHWVVGGGGRGVVRGRANSGYRVEQTP